MRFFDFVNDNPWLLLLACILALCLRCSSTDRADTVRLQERSETTLEQLDKAESQCLTDDCKTAIKQARELIKDSLDTLSGKDSEIDQVRDEIKENELYTDIGRFFVWGAIIVIIGTLAWVFRDNILALIKVVKPL